MGTISQPEKFYTSSSQEELTAAVLGLRCHRSQADTETNPSSLPALRQGEVLSQCLIG